MGFFDISASLGITDQEFDATPSQPDFAEVIKNKLFPKPKERRPKQKLSPVMQSILGTTTLAQFMAKDFRDA